jgi:hypothetical protein
MHSCPWRNWLSLSRVRWRSCSVPMAGFKSWSRRFWFKPACLPVSSPYSRSVASVTFWRSPSMLETGDIRRFATVGQYASYCRCVGSTKVSNGKRKGQGNTKNGNTYLAWAFGEAGHFAGRYDPFVQRFYQQKQAKTNTIVASKPVAHKLARACFSVCAITSPLIRKRRLQGRRETGWTWEPDKRGTSQNDYPQQEKQVPT